MGTAIKHPVPDRVKPSLVIFESGGAQPWAPECPDVKNYIWLLNPVWHRMLYSCNHMTTVGVKGLNRQSHEEAGVRHRTLQQFYTMSVSKLQNIGL